MPSTRPAFYGANSNQNYFANEVGGRTSSRVLCPPGGRSSIRLEWGSDQHEEILRKGQEHEHEREHEHGHRSENYDDNACDGNNNEIKRQLTRDDENNSSNRSISNNAFANGNNMNCGNVLTDRPSSRVLNPPGGKSTICLG